MILTRASYRNFSATQINNRMSDTCLHSVSDSNVNITYIESQKVATLLSEINTDLETINKSDSVNPWSAWGPTVRTVSGGKLVNSKPTNKFDLKCFGGYNENASTPAFKSGGISSYSFLNESGDYDFTCELNIGELLYNDVVGKDPVTYVHFSIWDGASWITDAYSIIALADAIDGDTDSDSIISFTGAKKITLSGIADTKTYTLKIWFCNDDVFDYTGANVMFQMDEFDDWTHQIRINSSNKWYVNGPENAQTYDGDGTFTSGKWDVINAQIDLSAGTILIDALKLNTLLTGGNHLHLTFIVESGYFDESGIWQGTIESTSTLYYDGVWNDATSRIISISSAFDIWTPATPMNDSGYGYVIKINCDVTTV